MKVYNLKQALQHKDQVKELYLNRMNLSAIPEAVFQIPNLIKLDLSYNNIDDLPEELDQLKNLEQLVLAHNPLETVPTPLMHLSHLLSLDLSYTSLKKFSTYISALNQLRTLKLTHNEIREIPNDIAQLKFLRRLDLSHNLINKISREIGRLSILERIDLSNNRVSSLPNAIGRCQSLEEINLKDNRLNKLPESIGNLIHLRKLNVDFNNLKEFPRSIEGCKQLRTITARQNRILHIDSLGRLPSLAYLHLNKNQLNTIPVSLGKCQRLYELELSNNKLETLPQIFWTFSQLTKIDLTKNQLRQLPRFGKSLKQLLATGNQIKKLSNSLSHAQKITRLELNGNPLEQIPEYFAQFKELSHLHFRGNNIQGQLPQALLHLDKLEELKGSIPQLSSSQLIRFIQSCRTAKVADHHRFLFFQALTGNQQAFTAVPRSVIFQGLNFAMPDVRYLARIHLLRQEKPNWSAQPLGRRAHLSVIGKTFFNLTELADRLAKLEIDFSQNVTRHTSHILLGYRPIKFEEAFHKSFVFLNEQMLSQFLDKAENRYLAVQKDAGQLKSLQELLLNPKDANIGLAIQLLKGGGVPPSLLTPLLVAWKFSSDRLIQKELRILLELNISEEARRALKYPISFSSKQSPERLEASLALLTDNTEFDKDQLKSFFKA